LHVQAVAMGALVIEQVHLAVSAYSNWDRAAATLVLERERKINLYDAEIEEAALQLIARRQPMAHDLRAVFAIDKVVTELERAADEAKKLALAVLADSEANGFRPGAATAREARQLGRLAALMIRSALEAFDRLDPVAAAAVIRQDQEMDSEYAAALRRILTRAMEDARQVQAAIEAAFIMRSLERIGDHARNIARHVGFIGGEFDPTGTGVFSSEVRARAD
jgi:phosphate transport system protein